MRFIYNQEADGHKNIQREHMIAYTYRVSQHKTHKVRNEVACAKRKCAFGNMRTAKAKISLHIREVWSWSLLSTKRIVRL